MLNVVLYQPEIPPNTGNIMRLCANSGCTLHLVGPLGFTLEDRQLRRAGLDYREWAEVRLHSDMQAFSDSVCPAHTWAVSTHGAQPYHTAQFAEGDAIVFGPETRGLPKSYLESPLLQGRVLRIPMVPGSRSLNLSNAVAVVIYEAWRQLQFCGSI